MPNLRNRKQKESKPSASVGTKRERNGKRIDSDNEESNDEEIIDTKKRAVTKKNKRNVISEEEENSLSESSQSEEEIEEKKTEKKRGRKKTTTIKKKAEPAKRISKRVKAKKETKKMNKGKKRKTNEEKEEDVEEEEDEESENESEEEEEQPKRRGRSVSKSSKKEEVNSKKKSKSVPKKSSTSISSIPEPEFLTSSSNNLITDCCINCNALNIYRAIHTSNKVLLKKCLEATNEIASVNSPLMDKVTPLQYCLKHSDKEMFTTLLNYFKTRHSRVKPPQCKLEYLSTGNASTFTFGFKTRAINLSRGNKLGNNAFLDDVQNKRNYDYRQNKYYRKDTSLKGILFHDDKTFLTFKNFVKLVKLPDHILINLLYENIDEGNINIVEYLFGIFAGKEIYGFNKLHSLVVSQKKKVDLDIKNKQSVNKMSQIRITPVHLACINPNEKIIEELIEKGGELEFQDSRGRKPISFAATCAGTGPLKVLIDNRCNVNDRESNGFTPIIHACRTGRYDNVKLLIEKGANVLHKPRPGYSMAIHYACNSNDKLNIVKLLLEKEPSLLEVTGMGKKTPLHFAVEYNAEIIVEYLVEQGAKLNAMDKFRRSPLLLAAKLGHTRILSYLISKGADIKKGDNSNNTPLHYACGYGHKECIQLLLDAGAELNCLNMWKSLPIEIALLKNHFGIVKFLLNSNECDVDSTFGNGNTVLLHSISEIMPETLEEIKYLIKDKNANVNVKNDDKMNALHMLTNFTYRAYLSNFLSKEEKKKLTEKNSNEHMKEYKNLLKEYLELLIDNGCDCNQDNNIGQTPLLLSIENGNFTFAIELIKMKKREVDVMKTDLNNRTIFDYCGCNGNSLKEECIEFLNYVLDNCEITEDFLNESSRYGRNALLSLCSDFAENFYERFYYISKEKATNFVKLNDNNTSQSKSKVGRPTKVSAWGRGAVRTATFKKNNVFNQKGLYSLSEKTKTQIKSQTISYMNEFIRSKFYPLIEKFVSKGCDINKTTEKKKFENAAKYESPYFNNYGNVSVLMYLMVYPLCPELSNLVKKYKMDINAKDNLGKTSLIYLIQNRPYIVNISKTLYQTCFDLLINNKDIDIDSIDNDKNSAFLICVLNGYEADALTLYQKHKNRIELNRVNKSFYSAMLYCVKSNNKKQVEFLLNNFPEIEVNKIDQITNRNALHYTCINNSASAEIDFSIFSMLIKANTDIRQKDVFGRNPLFYLFINENGETKENEDPISSFSYLLEAYKNKIDINETDILGKSLIFYALESKAMFCVSTLVSQGAEIETVNKNGNSVIAYTIDYPSSLPELYNQIKDVNVFNQKLYVEKEDMIKNIKKKIEEKMKGENCEQTLEEFFNNSTKNDNKKRNNNQWGRRKQPAQWGYKRNNKGEREIDEKLETLEGEDDDSQKYDYQGNFIQRKKIKNNDAFKSKWFVTGNNYESENNEIFEEGDINEEDQPQMVPEDEDEMNEEEEEENNNEDEEMEDVKEDDCEKLPESEVVLNECYIFNYPNEMETLIESIISKAYGISKYYNTNSLMKFTLPSRLNSITKTDIEEEEEEEEKQESESESTEIISKQKFVKISNNELVKPKKNKSNTTIVSDSLFKNCVENSAQNIIYYILNQGYDPFKACLAAIECNKLTLCFYLVERFNSISTSILNKTNEKGQNLIHILSKTEYIKENDNDIEKLCEVFINKNKISVNAFDNKGNLPLYYAIKNKNEKIVDILSKDGNYKNFLETKNKKKDKTPLNELYKNLKLLPKSILSIIVEIAKKESKGNLSEIMKYFAKNYEHTMKKDFEISKYKSNLSSDNVNKIIIGLYQHFINKLHQDIMTQDEKGNDVFSYCAIENNYDFICDVLLNESDIKYNQVNKEGKSLIHLLINPNKIGSYQNEKLLKKVIESGFEIDIKDNNGKTPLEYANEFKLDNYISILNKAYLEQGKDIEMEYDNNTENNNSNQSNSMYNYIEDSESFYKETIKPFLEAKKSPDNILYTLVDRESKLTRNNFLVCTDENNIPYNIDLAKVDINRFQYGEFLFYKLQLLKNIKRNMYILITRWGRFGTAGQFQKTPFPDMEEGIKEYKKIFQSKTGNDWDKIKADHSVFNKVPRKFNIVESTFDKPEIFNITSYFKSEMKNTKLSVDYDKKENKSVKDMFYYLITHAFTARFDNSYNRMNYNYNNNTEDRENNKYSMMYYQKETIEKGFKILNELSGLIEKMTNLKQKKTKMTISEKELANSNSNFNQARDEISTCNRKILSLSNQFYELIPFKESRNEFVSPICDYEQLKTEIDKLKSYTYIESTLKLFLGSLKHLSTTNPVDYVYNSIGCKLTPLPSPTYEQNPQSESDFIYDFIAKTSPQYRQNNYYYGKNSGNNNQEIVIRNVYKIENSVNDSKFNPENKGNRILLFHGTRVQNILGILSQGLMIAPVEAPSSGYKYGKGIYLTDFIEKAMDYSDRNLNKYYILICEAALGNTLQLSENKMFTSEKDIKAKGYDSIISDAYNHCSFEEVFYFRDGSGVFRKAIRPDNGNNVQGFVYGFGQRNAGKNYFKDQHAEYVLYKENLVRVKYIVEIQN